jgi:hypothetical protein
MPQLRQAGSKWSWILAQSVEEDAIYNNAGEEGGYVGTEEERNDFYCLQCWGIG